jgi:hypothetical protein
MRTIHAFLAATAALPAFAVSAAIAATQAHSPPRHTVYLDDAKVYEAIRAQDPARYEKILGILRVAQVEPCQTLPQILRTQYRVNASCHAYQVYTSFPAKTLLNFTVEDTDYVAFVVQPKLSGGELIPAR